MQYIFFVLVFAVYGFFNFYIGLRGFQSIHAQIPINKAVYWGIVIVFALMYFISMTAKNYLPLKLTNVLSIIGGYWLAAFVYLLAFVLIIDIFRLAAKRLGMMPKLLTNNSWFIAFLVMAAVSVILAVGTYSAVVPKIVSYDVAIDKKAGEFKSLKCAMISDVHLGEIVGRDRLHKAVQMINVMDADLVFIAGDLVDRDIEYVGKNNMLDELKSIKSKYGVFAVLGNHEYYAGKSDLIAQKYREQGVTVLRDQLIKIGDSVYIAGREDIASSMNGYERIPLDKLLDKADRSLPVIVLDHQPSTLDEARKAGVDLQLSGHTHAGQFFPISVATSLIFEKDKGMLHDKNFNLVVSSGFGTWGPTVRLGSQSEVVGLNIKFSK